MHPVLHVNNTNNCSLQLDDRPDLILTHVKNYKVTRFTQFNVPRNLLVTL
jgi:hypothetical protein